MNKCRLNQKESYKLRQNFDKLKEGDVELDELSQTDFENWLQRNYNRTVKGLGAQEYSDLVRKYKMQKDREEEMTTAVNEYLDSRSDL